MSSHGIPYTAISISKSQVASYITAGSPVVAHIPNHYVCIYGIIGDTCYYSDGATGYGAPGSTSIGVDGHLRIHPWSSFPTSSYNGFNHN